MGCSVIGIFIFYVFSEYIVIFLRCLFYLQDADFNYRLVSGKDLML